MNVYPYYPPGLEPKPYTPEVEIVTLPYFFPREEETKYDNVEKPAHYNQSGIECIEAIKASMSKEEYEGYLKGNVEKYVWRYRYKNGLEDLKKAQWYLQRLVESVEVES